MHISIGGFELVGDRLQGKRNTIDNIKEIQLTISKKYISQDPRNALLEYAFELVENRLLPS